MAEEPFALSTVAPRSEDESDYEAICATVMESARGRWFLEEYARRNRQADTALVLAAIHRLESLIAGGRAGQASAALRAELLEMAKAISQARGQSAASDPLHMEGQTDRSTEYSGMRAEIFATAERIHDVAWTMRERGMDPATCQEIETLASSILTTSSLQGATPPADARIEKLKDVLQYLERRIHTVLDACSPASMQTADTDEEKRADGETRPRETDFDVVSTAEKALLPEPAQEKEAASTGVPPDEDRQAKQSEPVAASPASGELDDSAAQICLEGTHASLDQPSMRPEALDADPWDDTDHADQQNASPVLPFPGFEQTVETPAPTPLAIEREHESGGSAQLTAATPMTPCRIDPVDAPHDDVLSGAWEDVVLHPEAEAAHQARLASTRPPEVEANKNRLAVEPAAGLSPLAPEVMEILAVSPDSSIDPIQEIERELFAPSFIESANVESAKLMPASEPPRVKPIEELLPQPTLTETSPALSVVAAPIETAPAPRPAIDPALQRQSVVSARPIVRSMPQPAPADPLAALRAMTDEERIALFS